MYRHICRQCAELVCGAVCHICLGCADLLPDLRHGLRHECAQRNGDDADGLQQVVQDGCQTGAVCLVLRQNPRCSLVDVLVGTGNYLEDLRQHTVQLGLIQQSLQLFFQSGGCGNQLVVELARLTLFRQCAAEVLVHHGYGTGNQVAQTVRQVGVDAVNHDLVGERAVCAQCHFPEDVIPDGICAVAVCQQERVNHVAQGLGHLLSVEGDPAVNCQMLRQRQIQRHQHCRPDNGVETHDVLGNHVDICRPVFVEVVVCAVLISQSADIVGQRIYPHVDHVLGVEGDRDAPGERGTGNAQVFQTGLDEVVDQFYRTGLGLEIVGLQQQLFDALCKGCHLHEVSLFLCLGDLPVAFRTAAVFVQLGLRPEAFARCAVLALIFALIDVSQVVQALEDLLYGFYMIVVCGADIAVIADVHFFPQCFEGLNDLIYIFFRRDTLCRRFLFNFQTVFICSGEENDIIALHSSEPGDRIAGYSGVAVTDVGISRRIVDRCRDIIRLF